jgi:cytochrome c biogenesis protein CcmG, thiol:disulfide interchange protein DsbE
VVQELGGRARFVTENYGDSQLARRFGVKRYPAIFVDDVLVATPKDFGFYGQGEGEGKGRYAPIRAAAAQERFRSDLARTIALVLAGRKQAAHAQAAPAATAPASVPPSVPAAAAAAAAAPLGAGLAATAALPDVIFTTLDGTRLTRRDLAGRVVALEVWATWCPPCRAALGWLGEMKRRYGDRLLVVAVAVESDPAEVRKVAGALRLPFAWAVGTPEQVSALGGISAVPTLLVFDRQGRAAATFFGAPPNLHAEAGARLAALLGGEGG